MSFLISIKMKNKKLDLSDLGGFVFSTNSDFKIENETEAIETLPPHQQKLEAHLDKKNRAGKVATIIKGFQGSDEDLKAFAKELKTLCGVGGTQKEGEVIIQGNFRDKIMNYLTTKGFKIKRVGG
jgi:translation initiation factor 1